MTDKELGRILAECFMARENEGTAWEAVASRARELLAPESLFNTVAEMSAAHDLAAEYKHRFSQLDRIEKKLDWMKWWTGAQQRDRISRETARLASAGMTGLVYPEPVPQPEWPTE